MCRGVQLSLLAVFLCLTVSIASATEPLYAVLSTEVNELLDGAGGFMDRQMLQFWPPDYNWSGNLSQDLFFDPGPILGVETGLDAYHYRDGLHYFSTEVDVYDQGRVLFEDEDLLVYDPGTGAVTQAFDVKDVLGEDHGLDAACWFFDEMDSEWMLLFSTEAGGSALMDGSVQSFTDGDLLVADPSGLSMVSLEEYFGRNVGLDALHVTWNPDDSGAMRLEVLISTEFDGQIRVADGVSESFVDFKDEDILMMLFAFDDGPGGLLEANVPWRGVEDGFGWDVGLDALYIEPIPEPTTMLLAGLGLGALALKFKRKK